MVRVGIGGYSSEFSLVDFVGDAHHVDSRPLVLE